MTNQYKMYAIVKENYICMSTLFFYSSGEEKPPPQYQERKKGMGKRGRRRQRPVSYEPTPSTSLANIHEEMPDLLQKRPAKKKPNKRYVGKGKGVGKGKSKRYTD